MHLFKLCTFLSVLMMISLVAEGASVPGKCTIDFMFVNYTGLFNFIIESIRSNNNIIIFDPSRGKTIFEHNFKVYKRLHWTDL